MSKRLLIVEDNELNRDLLQQILEEDYEILLAEDGEAAIETFSADPPDLILMDIDLPGISGLETVRAIRTSPRGATIPIVAVSAGVMPGEREQAIEAGCDDFVAKPIDDVLLVELVGRLLERP